MYFLLWLKSVSFECYIFLYRVVLGLFKFDDFDVVFKKIFMLIEIFYVKGKKLNF